MVKKILDSLVEVETLSLTPSLEARFVPTPNAPSNYALNFANPIFILPMVTRQSSTTNDFIYFDSDEMKLWFMQKMMVLENLNFLIP